MKQQKGFTLIELVVVIVILGILAATALPKFVDLSGDAAKASAQGFAAALSSASTMNYAKVKASGSTTGITPTTIGAGGPATDCTDANMNSMLATNNPLPTGMVTSGTGATACTSGQTMACTLTYKTQTATATIVCY